MKFTVYTAFCALVATTAALPQDISGSGQIYVINSTDFQNASPADSIGCLNAQGGFSESDCATFTRLDTYPNTLSTSSGNCTFSDSTQPANTDSVYGSRSYSYFCREDYASSVTDSLYTINGFNYAFLCHGDRNCFYDVKTIPSDSTIAPVWEYVWGSQQTGIPEGHTQVMWYWNKNS
ncbi:hypothetical protein F4813DRAFT_53091 [Daldinia decipiens]|uniref:uncharacterized protein n=1 Tax=Daldinia decipiens TaxID=326647 RepID=UPI0020C4A2ED|nr:uncharacterized protein F4813DRAFT_53091 [Daldinia decipiens]KAI1658065.1 hypothetical protein F4813DRAFT_53091 [Daldinia decipiens]